jgi:hypothetical protein
LLLLLLVSLVDGAHCFAWFAKLANSVSSEI